MKKHLDRSISYKRWTFRQRSLHYFLLHLARLLSKFVRYEVRGKHHLPIEGHGTLLVANHLSHLDSIIIAVAAYPRKRLIHFGGAKDFMEKWYFRWTKYEGAFPVGRGPGEREKAIRTAARLLNDGSSVGIFPEGRRSRTGVIGEARPGAGWIASLSRDALVVPVFLWGTQHIMPPYTFGVRPGAKVLVVFGEPIALDSEVGGQPSIEYSRRVVSQIMSQVKRLGREALKDY